MISNKLAAIRNNRAKNNKIMIKMIDVARNRIVKQGSGCFIANYGVSYVNYENNTRDVIGHLLGINDVKRFWGPISDEPQKPLVNKLKNKFNVNIINSGEYSRFTKFLQLLQSAHDDAFCEFNNNKSPKCMDIFTNRCNEINDRLINNRF